MPMVSNGSFGVKKGDKGLRSFKNIFAALGNAKDEPPLEVSDPTLKSLAEQHEQVGPVYLLNIATSTMTVRTSTLIR